jgi:hypothetical protein
MRIGVRRKREEECRTFAELRLRPDFAAVLMDDALDDRQSHAGPRKLGLRMQALERREQPMRLSHSEADAVVPDEVHRAFAAARRLRCAFGCLLEYFQAFDKRLLITMRKRLRSP